MSRKIAGLKIREKRRSLGLKQNELAHRVGISPSYLNLIESNKRGIGGTLLIAIGRELSLSTDELDGSSERRLRHQLAAVADDPEIGSGRLRDGSIEALIARYPQWARVTAGIHTRMRDAESTADALTDRLAHDPVLAEAIHGMLTEVTALRSTAEILADPREIDPAQRKRFEKVVDEQSSRLARSCASLARYFDHTAENRRTVSAQEIAEEFLFSSDPAELVERTATEIRAQHIAPGQDPEQALAAGLSGLNAVPAHWNRNQRLAFFARARVRASSLIDLPDFLTDCPSEALPHAQSGVEQMTIDAVRLPAGALTMLGAQTSWELNAMAHSLDGDTGLLMRRIAALHRSDVPRAGWISVDASGATRGRGGALDLLPRARGLECPVWPVHRTGSNNISVSAIEISGGERRLIAARQQTDGYSGDMLVMSDKEPLINPKPAQNLQTGLSCRICIHRDCAHRREPAVINS